MSQSLPVLRGAALGQCCCSLAVIDDVMGRLALLQSYFSLMSNPSPATPASGAAPIPTKAAKAEMIIKMGNVTPRPVSANAPVPGMLPI